jgi:hypothetical protein
MKEKLYKKEIWLTIVFTVLLMLTGHSATLFVLFPGLQQGTMWGFPIQYILPIVLGWFGLALVCWVMAVVCNRFDDEMEALAEQEKKNRVTVKTA